MTLFLAGLLLSAWPVVGQISMLSSVSPIGSRRVGPLCGGVLSVKGAVSLNFPYNFLDFHGIPILIGVMGDTIESTVLTYSKAQVREIAALLRWNCGSVAKVFRIICQSRLFKISDMEQAVEWIFMIERIERERNGERVLPDEVHDWVFE